MLHDFILIKLPFPFDNKSILWATKFSYAGERTLVSFSFPFRVCTVEKYEENSTEKQN